MAISDISGINGGRFNFDYCEVSKVRGVAFSSGIVSDAVCFPSSGGPIFASVVRSAVEVEESDSGSGVGGEGLV